MTLRELINKVADKGHLSKTTQFIHKEYYPDQANSEREGIDCSYQVVVGELLELPPKEARYEICVHKKDGAEETDVSLYCEEDEETYAMDLTPWEDIIDAKIKNDLQTLTWEHELLAHILWEITFYGFTQDKVELSKDQMEQLVEEVREVFGKDDNPNG
jgi:hypothetical protein